MMQRYFIDYSGLSKSDVDKINAQLQQYAISMTDIVPEHKIEFVIADDLLSKIDLPENCTLTKQ
nr:MAG TPA: hypothetical protein [Caudoviricetes sp.]